MISKTPPIKPTVLLQICFCRSASEMKSKDLVLLSWCEFIGIMTEVVAGYEVLQSGVLNASGGQEKKLKAK